MKPRRRFSRSVLRAPLAAIEYLEARTLLTGNVMAAVTSGGNLLVLGDSKANQISIQSTSGGALQVASLDGTTKINGGSGPFTANGVTGNVFVFLGQGNDVVEIGGGTLTTNIPQNLLIVLGKGNDTVNILNASITKNAAVFGGAGKDTITVGDETMNTIVSVGGNLLIDGGSGSGAVTVFDVDVTGNLCVTDIGGGGWFNLPGLGGLETIGCAADPSAFGISGCFAFAGKEGADFFANQCGPSCLGLFNALSGCGFGGGSRAGTVVAISGDTVGGNLSIRTGAGNDEILIGAAPMAGSSSLPTQFLLPVSVGGNLNVSSGEGNDTVLLVQVTMNGNSQITTGNGSDDIGVLECMTSTGTFTIRAGRGNDSIVLSDGDVFLGNLTVYGGFGNDTIGLQNSSFQAVTINGGHGQNTFLQTQPPFADTFGSLTLNSIQTSSDVTVPEFTAAFPWLTALLPM